VTGLCVHGARALPSVPSGSLVAIGNFDGVHRGHRQVVQEALQLAKAEGLRPVVLTFHPHPVTFVTGRPVQQLTGVGRRCELLGRLSPELVVVTETFDAGFAGLTPHQFVDDYLIGMLDARLVCVGDNFRFGHDRAGDVGTLIAVGAGRGLRVRPHRLEADADGTFSSSRARHALRDADLAAFREVTGRPHSVAGSVVRGRQLGRTLGVPTANLVEVEEVLPAHGVYATVVESVGERPDGHRRLGLAATSVGTRPTLQDEQVAVEAHLLDFDADLYGQRLRVHFLQRLRGIERFESLELLKAQMGRDLAEVRRILTGLQPAADAGCGWF
jgi:riboflavin kinase/FMN adenylyltransferase